MELVPKQMILGVIVQPPLPGLAGAALVDRNVLNRIWAEVNSTFPYQSLQMSPAGDAALFIGSSGPNEGVSIQPPVIQIRDPIRSTSALAADQAQAILKIVSRHFGSPLMFNLGIRHIFHAQVDQAKAFLLHRILKKDEEEFDVLRQGGNLWTGTKFVISHPDGHTFTLLLEPFLANDSLLVVDVDAQFPGPVQLDLVKERAREAETFVTTAVSEYLDTQQL